MQRIITENIEKITDLCQNHKVDSLYVFGSASGDAFNENSDIDLLVAFQPMSCIDYSDNYFILAEKFEALFENKVDLITEKSLSNPFFIDSVNQTKVLLYGHSNQ